MARELPGAIQVAITRYQAEHGTGDEEDARVALPGLVKESPPKLEDLGPVGIFASKYLGSVPVDDVKGMVTVNAALAVLLAKIKEGGTNEKSKKAKAKKRREHKPEVVSRAMALTVNVEGVRILDPLTAKAIFRCAITSVIFTCIAKDTSDSQEKEYVCFVSRDERLARLSAHFLDCPTTHAEYICGVSLVGICYGKAWFCEGSL